MNTETLRAEVKDFLENHRKAVFATVDETGTPHSSLMFYATDADLNFYFGTRASFDKYTRIKSNPNVALTVIEEGVEPKRVVEVRGKAEEVAVADRDKTYALMKEKNPQNSYVEGAEDFVMFAVRPSLLRFVDASSGELTITNL